MMRRRFSLFSVLLCLGCFIVMLFTTACRQPSSSSSHSEIHLSKSGQRPSIRQVRWCSPQDGCRGCEAVPKSKKLLCSQVKIGSQVKQIVSGIRKHYTPEEMVGKKVMVLVNLKPAKLAGVLSEGMLLCAEDAEGNLALMTPEKAMPAGAEIC